MTINRQHFVVGLTWDQVAQRLSNGASAILPAGSGCKQHGLHLPMGTDRLQAEWFAAQLSAKIDALVWPTLTYGFYPAFSAYPGSLSVTSETLAAVAGEIVDGLIRYGARRIFVLDTGLSTNAPIAKALAAFQSPERVHHLKLYSGPRFLSAVNKLSQQSHGSHADEIETSIMLAIAADAVDMARAEASPHLSSGPQSGPLNRDDPSSANYSASGSFGDPLLASAEKGKKFVEAILEDLLESIAKA